MNGFKYSAEVLLSRKFALKSNNRTSRPFLNLFAGSDNSDPSTAPEGEATVQDVSNMSTTSWITHYLTNRRAVLWLTCWCAVLEPPGDCAVSTLYFDHNFRSNHLEWWDILVMCRRRTEHWWLIWLTDLFPDTREMDVDLRRKRMATCLVSTLWQDADVMEYTNNLGIDTDNRLNWKTNTEVLYVSVQCSKMLEIF